MSSRNAVTSLNGKLSSPFPSEELKLATNQKSQRLAALQEENGKLAHELDLSRHEGYAHKKVTWQPGRSFTVSVIAVISFTLQLSWVSELSGGWCSRFLVGLVF